MKTIKSYQIRSSRYHRSKSSVRDDCAIIHNRSFRVSIYQSCIPDQNFMICSTMLLILILYSYTGTFRQRHARTIMSLRRVRLHQGVSDWQIILGNIYYCNYRKFPIQFHLFKTIQNKSKSKYQSFNDSSNQLQRSDHQASTRPRQTVRHALPTVRN